MGVVYTPDQIDAVIAALMAVAGAIANLFVDQTK